MPIIQLLINSHTLLYNRQVGCARCIFAHSMLADFLEARPSVDVLDAVQ